MRPLETASGLAAVLRGVVADMQHASGADIVSIFLYEESSGTYYAPFANGQPQESLLDALADMREQLARYTTDLSQGKVPDDFAVHHYGSTVWLTITRQKLIARDAASEIDSTFIRRYQVQATIGLPLLAGERLLGLVYLNYRERDHAPDSVRLEELDRRAAAAAAAIESVLAAAERTALEGLGRLTALLTAPVGDARADIKELRRLLSIGLAELLLASDLDAAAIYQFGAQRSSLELVTANAPVAAPSRVVRRTEWEPDLTKAVGAATAVADLHPVATYALGRTDDVHGYLVVLSRDRLATVRRAQATDVLLKAGAELIGGVLATQRLITGLENSNRLLGARQHAYRAGPSRMTAPWRMTTCSSTSRAAGRRRLWVRCRSEARQTEPMVFREAFLRPEDGRTSPLSAATPRSWPRSPRAWSAPTPRPPAMSRRLFPLSRSRARCSRRAGTRT